MTLVKTMGCSDGFAGFGQISRSEWWLITLATLLPCGIHFAMGINSLRIYFLTDPLWQPPIDGARWGLFQAILTFPNLLLPVIGGLFMDILNKTLKGTRIFLLFTVIGQWLFTLGVYMHSFPISIGGRLLFGLGSGGVSSASGTILAKGLRNRRRLNIVAGAVGISEAFHAFSTLASSALPVYIVDHTGVYWSPIVLGGVVCTLCMVLGCMTIAEIDTPTMECSFRKSVEGLSSTTRSIPLILIPLLCIHFCTSGAHRLFGHVDSAFFYTKYDVNTKDAGLMSGAESLLGIFLPPLLGSIFFSLENIAKAPAIALAMACVCGAIGYFMLFRGAMPALPLFLLSLCNACTPTLLKALVAIMVPSSSLATAFGLFEASESLVKTIGGVAVGIFRDKEGGYGIVVALFGVMLLVACVSSLCLAFFGKAHAYTKDQPLLEDA